MNTETGIYSTKFNIIYLNKRLLRLEKIETNEKFSLVVDGKTLVDIMDYFSEKFLEICLQCEAVLCCRMSPGQKADVISFIKNFE